MIKKLLALCLVLTMIMAVTAACGQAANTNANASTTASATTAQATQAKAEETTAKAEETTAKAEEKTTKAAETTKKAAETTAKAAETTAPAAAASGSAADLPYVELTIYMMGEVGEDMDQFYEIFDAWTLRDFNCKVRFKHANTWIDYAAKYNLMLTADDTIDMCYAANWIDFYAYAKKDAFEDITELLPVYCPQIWAAYPRERFNGASVNNKIYGVPQNWTNYHGENFIWREDLRKKYGLPEMKLEWDILENYMQTVIENEDIPFAVTYQYTNPVSLFLTIDLPQYSGIDATAVGMRSERNTKNTILFYEEPAYRDFAKRMKRWCDLGFWSKSILATADSSDHTDLFAEGRIFVVTNSHVDRFQGIPERILKEGIPYEVGFIPHASVNGIFYHTRTAQDLTCIPNGSKNPERALMVLDKLIMDKEYYDLTQYGMLGLNYELDENNSASYKNIDTTAHRFDLCLWAMRNQDLAYPVSRFWDRKAEYEDVYFPKLQYDPFDGFAIDLKDIQAEFTAVTQVMKEYGDPIQWGVVQDPDAAVDTLIQRMNDAGMQKFKAEIDRQISEYLDSKK